MARRLLGAAIAIALLAAAFGWLIVGILGFGQLFPSVDDGGCQQPEYLYAVALMLEALLGLGAAVIGIRGGVRVMRARSRAWADALALAATGLLAGAFVVTAVTFNPNFTVVPGPC